jgi:hypothetical protein
LSSHDQAPNDLLSGSRPLLGDVAKVKSVHIDPASKRLLWIQGDGTQWWSDVLHLRDPETNITLPGEKIYKVRWMPMRLKNGSAGAPENAIDGPLRSSNFMRR